MNYVDSFIAAADDCPVRTGTVPRVKPGGKKSVAVIQYELLNDSPYVYTQEDVLFHTHVRHKDIPVVELEARGEALRAAFLATPQPCLRASPLAKKYGWGFHFDGRGKAALCALESSEYRMFAGGAEGAPTVLKAFRSSRERKDA